MKKIRITNDFSVGRFFSNVRIRFVIRIFFPQKILFCDSNPSPRPKIRIHDLTTFFYGFALSSDGSSNSFLVGHCTLFAEFDCFEFPGFAFPNLPPSPLPHSINKINVYGLKYTFYFCCIICSPIFGWNTTVGIFRREYSSQVTVVFGDPVIMELIAYCMFAGLYRR